MWSSDLLEFIESIIGRSASNDLISNVIITTSNTPIPAVSSRKTKKGFELSIAVPSPSSCLGEFPPISQLCYACRHELPMPISLVKLISYGVLHEINTLLGSDEPTYAFADSYEESADIPGALSSLMKRECPNRYGHLTTRIQYE